MNESTTHISVKAAVLRNNVFAMLAMGVIPCEIADYINNTKTCTSEEKKSLLEELHLRDEK